jgi:hypothetical protein
MSRKRIYTYCQTLRLDEQLDDLHAILENCPGDYADFNGDVFLLQSSDLYEGTPQPKVQCLSKAQAESFCHHNLNLLPASIEK